MMVVHTSNVEPLPHQITAVYESLLPKQPLRFVLADDPGAGKTIMAGLYKVETSDIMRRMVKEDMLRFDGTHLFPLRRATRASYKLSPPEAALYEAVTSYVRNEMNRADSLQDNTRRSSVGFALAALQRRQASSPEAIYQSLQRRHSKMKRRLEEERLRAQGGMLPPPEYVVKVPMNCGMPRTSSSRKTWKPWKSS